MNILENKRRNRENEIKVFYSRGSKDLLKACIGFTSNFRIQSCKKKKDVCDILEDIDTIARAKERERSILLLRKRMKSIEEPRDMCDKLVVCVLGQLIFELKEQKEEQGT